LELRLYRIKRLQFRARIQREFFITGKELFFPEPDPLLAGEIPPGFIHFNTFRENDYWQTDPQTKQAEEQKTIFDEL
jgi:hypothetical protein